MHVPHASLIPFLLFFLLNLTTKSSGAGWKHPRDGKEAGSEEASMDSDLSGPERRGMDEPVLCDDAQLQCTMRTGCQMALNNFFRGCRSLLAGEKQHCTTACQHALVSLLTTEDGAGVAFVHCHCHGERTCRERKRRVQVCQRHVLRSMTLVRDQKSTLSCSLARWICEADTSCLAALHYYVQHCSKLFAGTRCTARCRNSVHILYRQPSGHKLRTCRCEGDEDYDCAGLVNNTERLCLRPHRHHHDHLHHHTRPHNSVIDDREEDRYRQPGRQSVVSATPLRTSGEISGLKARSSGTITVSAALYVIAVLCLGLLLPPACL